MLRRLRAAVRDLSLRAKLFWGTAVFFTLLVLISGLLSYSLALRQVEARQQLILLQNLEQAAALVDFNLNVYASQVEILASNAALQDAVSGAYRDFTARYAAHAQIAQLIEPVAQGLVFSSSRPSTVGNTPVDVVIFSSNPTLARESGIVRPLDEVAGEPWAQQLLANGGVLWRGPFTEYGVTYLSVNRRLRSARTLQDLGILTIQVPQARIAGLLTSNNKLIAGDIYLVQPHAFAIPMAAGQATRAVNVPPIASLAPAAEGVTEISLAGTRYLLGRAAVGGSGWDLVAVLPLTTITDALASIRYSTALILGLGVALCVAFTYLIASTTTRRLNAITRKMNRLRANWKAPLEVIPGNDEVGQLDATLNELVTTLNAVTEEELRLRLQRSHLQVELLQAQINPHLLYNTLATINWRARQAKVGDVADATDALIRFYRRFLNRGEALSSFSAELEIVRENLRILKFTYNLQFEEQITVEAALLPQPCLHLLLQPIVENAVVHGLRPAAQPGVLTVSGCTEGERVRFTVRDNGVGMERELVERINHAAEAAEPSLGYGLINAQRRIRLYFGPEYGLTVASAPDAGATVTLVLPLITAEELHRRLDGAH